MKRVVLLLTLVIFGGNAHSGIIDIVTGADMAGMQVTAFFENGSSETATWVVLNDPQPRPESNQANIPLFEVYSGEAAGSGWSLYQQGESFGDIDGNNVYGEWVLSNQSGLAMTRLVIDALAGNIVFDQLFGVEGTPGSNVGRTFTAPNLGVVSAVYSDLYSAPDLYGMLTISWANNLASGSEQRFLADTDKIPLPGTLLLMLLGSLGIAARTGRGLNRE